MAIPQNTLLHITLLALASISSASPVVSTTPNNLKPRDGCFSGGTSFNDAGFASGQTAWISVYCAQLSQTYFPSQTRSRCITGSNAADHINLSIENTADDRAVLTETDCIHAILTEFNACEDGSEQQYGSFHYDIDPNSGSC